jgi:hypothetical protein
MFTIILIVLAFIIIAVAIFQSDIYLPKNIRYLRYLAHDINPPKDLYEYIMEDRFNFHEKGFARTYSLKPKYSDLYDVGFILEEKFLSSKYKFNGKLKIEFLKQDDLLYQKIIDQQGPRIYRYGEWGFDWAKEVVLHTFEIPLQGKYKKNIAIRITVLEPDLELKEYKDSIKLFIGVSSTP